MNTLQIKYFLSAVACRSLSRAADMYFISQPALSKQIQNLEQELGVTLLNRGSRGVSLTEAGRLMHNHFVSMNQDFELVLDKARRICGSEAAALQLGLPDDWDVSRFLPDIRREFAKTHAGVAIHTDCRNSIFNLLSGLRDNVFDALFIPFVPAIYLEGLSTLHLTEVPLALILSRRHPLCAKDPLLPADFEDEPFLVAEHDGFNIARWAIAKYVASYGFSPRMEPRSSMSSVVLGVLNNEGVALRTVWSIAIHNPGLRHVDISATQSAYLAYRTDNDSDTLRDFIQLTLAHFGNTAAVPEAF